MILKSSLFMGYLEHEIARTRLILKKIIVYLKLQYVFGYKYSVFSLFNCVTAAAFGIKRMLSREKFL